MKVNKNDLPWENGANPRLRLKNILANYEIEGGKLSCGISKWPYGAAGELHIHACLDEIYIVLSGEGRAYLDGQYTTVRPGDMVHIPAGEDHGLIEGLSEDGIELFYILCPKEAAEANE